MASIDKTITVDVPLLTAYAQWTQFEDFPKFMEGVTEVRQLDSKRLHWHAERMGVKADWFAMITQAIPGQIIAWRNLSGARNAGGVAFHSLGPARTLLTMRIEFEPAGPAEFLDSLLARISLRIEGDLRRFKKFIEERIPETGTRRSGMYGARIVQPSVP